MHATCVAVGDAGLLLRGPPGAGKSDLALRLIDGGARLVADDQTELRTEGGRLLARAPEVLAGKLEVRGLGILDLDHRDEVPVCLLVDLTPGRDPERLPEPERAVAEMIRILRPGGTLVAIDTDFGTLSVDSPELDVERRLMRLLADRFHHGGYAGRQLYRLLRNQGLEEVRVELFGLPFTDLETMARGARFDELERLALETGVVDGEEIARWREGLERAAEEGTFYGSLTQVLVAGRA